MRENFQKIIGWVLEEEGYRTNDPKDPGKLTIWGVSIVYHPVEVARMAKMSKEEAMKYASDLYLKKYWLPAGCDLLPYPKDVIIFDIAINPGFKLANELRAGTGSWQDYLLDRLAYYCERLRKNPVKVIYIGGWKNRTIALRNLINIALKPQ